MYGSTASLAWRIGDIIESRSIIDRIARLQRPGEGNNLPEALQVAKDVLFDPKNGARSNVPKSLVVFTDGTDFDKAGFVVELKKLRDAVVNVILIAVGPNVDIEKLMSLVPSSKDKVLKIPNIVPPSEDLVSKVATKAIPGIVSHLYYVYLHGLVFEISFCKNSRQAHYF